MSKYKFCFQPRWILSHLLVIGLIVLMVNLAFWQLRRLDEKRDFNRLVRAREHAAAVSVDRVVPADATFDQAKGVLYRRVTAQGHYLPDQQVIVRGRTFQSESGAWLLTPLQLADGTAVVVNRGWVPVQSGITLQPEWGPPTGRVTVTGLLFPTQVKGRFGSTDPATGHLDTLARADLGRLQQQVDEDLYPAYLQLTHQEPHQPGDLPAPLGPPELSEGPHLNYAGQWFIFSTIALVGYPLILRRVARNKQLEAEDEADTHDADGDDDGGVEPDVPEPVRA